MATRTAHTALAPVDSFVARHIGPSEAEQQEMLATLGYQSLEAFIDAVVPESIRFRGTLATGPERSEADGWDNDPTVSPHVTAALEQSDKARDGLADAVDAIDE